jgi:PhnB protein
MTDYKPKGYPNLIPYLIVKGVPALIEFMQKVLDAEVVERIAMPDGEVMHAEVRIGDSIVMLGEAGPRSGSANASLHLYVRDVDATYKAALKAGAASLSEPTNQFYGDRSAGVKDASGNTWYLSTHVEDVPYEEIQRRINEQKR